MPKVNDYKKNKVKSESTKRRPGRDPEEHMHARAQEQEEEVHSPVEEAKVVEAAASTMASTEDSEKEAPAQFDPYDSSNYEEKMTEPTEEEKTHLDFYGSELIRLKAPKVMEAADEIVDQWKKDGDFHSVPVGHPLAQIAVAKGLRTAKDVEKKLEEKGVFAMAKMGLMYAEHELKKRGIIKK